MDKLSLQAAIQQQIESASTEDLNRLFDETNQKIENFKAVFKATDAETIKTLFDSSLFKLNYQHAKMFLAVYEKLDIESGLDIQFELIEFRAIQQIIMQSSFSNSAEAKLISNCLDSCKTTNEQLYVHEMELQLYAVELERRRKEEATSLKFSEEDNANVKKLEVRPNPLIEATKTGEEYPVIVEDEEATTK
jgi:hypothetical protein